MAEPNVTIMGALRTARRLPAQAAARSREDVVKILCEQSAAIRELGATALYQFGSAARDEMTAESDVDVFIDCDSDGSFTFVEWARLEKLLRACLGRDVDVLTRRSLHPRLKERIERSSIRVF